MIVNYFIRDKIIEFLNIEILFTGEYNCTCICHCYIIYWKTSKNNSSCSKTTCIEISNLLFLLPLFQYKLNEKLNIFQRCSKGYKMNVCIFLSSEFANLFWRMIYFNIVLTLHSKSWQEFAFCWHFITDVLLLAFYSKP